MIRNCSVMTLPRQSGRKPTPSEYFRRALLDQPITSMNQGSPPTDRAAAAADPPAAVGQTSSASTDQFDPGEHDGEVEITTSYRFAGQNTSRTILYFLISIRGRRNSSLHVLTPYSLSPSLGLTSLPSYLSFGVLASIERIVRAEYALLGHQHAP